MFACTFFGHGDSPDSLFPILKEKILNLLIHHQVTVFYVGTHGNFDIMAYRASKELQVEYPVIRVYRVLAYMPKEEIADSILPEGIELVHPKYAISWRNKWMLDHADYVIAYTTHNYGGAAKYVKQANRKCKTVIIFSAFILKNNNFALSR